MKRTGLFLLLPLLAVISCSKSTKTSTNGNYRGVVLHNVCCQDVIQVLDTSMGINAWTDSNITNRPIFNHVFTVSNPCDFGSHAEGDTITFRLVPQTAQNCACCMLFMYTPSIKYPIQVIY